MPEQPSGPTPNIREAEDIKNRIDRMPSTPQEWADFAALPAADRSAVYLRSIRSMLVFFTVLAGVGIVGVLLSFLVHSSS